MSRRSRRTTSLVAGVLFVTLAAGACSGDDDEPDATPSDATPTASEPAVVTEVSFGKVTGRLPGPARQRLADQVQGVVDGWIDAAYLDGDYPRRDFADSWPGFTAGARAEAKRDGALMSNRDVGAKVDGVEPRKRRLRIDVLAVKKHPVGVTAHVDLRFATTGTDAAVLRVAGRLYLTHGKQGWQVFGYDVTKGDAR